MKEIEKLQKSMLGKVMFVNRPDRYPNGAVVKVLEKGSTRSKGMLCVFLEPCHALNKKKQRRTYPKGFKKWVPIRCLQEPTL